MKKHFLYLSLAKKLPAFSLAILTSLAITSVSNADIVQLNHTNELRLTDNNPADGIGDGRTANAPQVGSFSNGTNLAGLVVFQMTGITNGADILSADFSLTQFANGTDGTFDVSAHVVRTASTGATANSDYQDSVLKLQDNFDANAAAGSSGVVSLDSGGEANLLSWLNANWVENDFVFIGLKSDTLFNPTSNNLFSYNGNDSILTLTTAVPEPGSLALLSMSALGLCCFRRRVS